MKSLGATYTPYLESVNHHYTNTLSQFLNDSLLFVGHRRSFAIPWAHYTPFCALHHSRSSPLQTRQSSRVVEDKTLKATKTSFDHVSYS